MHYGIKGKRMGVRIGGEYLNLNNSYKPIVLFVRHMQTVQTQIRRRVLAGASNQGLICLLKKCSIKI